MLFCIVNLHAQFFSKGADPAGLKWNQIKTGHFKVIFPEDFSDEAQRFTHILEKQYDSSSDQLGHRPRPIPVIIHNHSVLSNGFVSWAPRRMEVVPIPSAYGFSQDALEQLALHEFRHVVQVDKLNQGFTKFLRIPLGQGGTGAVAGLLPLWFLEGNAVDAETRLSLSGRGRLPSWEMELKAILAENKTHFSYEKAFRGSFRDYVPNHYKYGYQMVAHGRVRYGNGIWDSLVDYTARKPYTLYPFSFGLRKYAGSSKTGLYNETLSSLSEHWEEQASMRKLTQSLPRNITAKKYYTNYRYAGYLPDGSIFAEKSGIDQINEFVSIDDQGTERRIHRPGFYDPANISVSGGVIAWTEIAQDVRWERRDYSVIKLYYLEREQERVLTWKTRYFAPDLNEDASKLTAIEADEKSRYYLLVMDIPNAEVERRIPSPGNRFLQYPVWSHDQKGIYMTALGGEGKKIVYYDLESGSWTDVFDAGFENIAELDAGRDFLVFRGTFSGIDNIYAIILKTSECQQVTSSRFGAFMPEISANGDKLLFSDYTSRGFDIHEMNLDPGLFIPLELVRDHREQKNLPSQEDETLARSLLEGPVQSYNIEPFRKYLDIVNFHTWLPFYTDIENPDFRNPEISPGFMLFSQNKLSTATTMLGYEYRNQDHFMHASFTWSGWLPVIRASYDFGGTPLVASPPEGVTPLTRVKTDMNLNLEISLPLNLTMNRYVTGLIPSIESSVSRAYFYYTDPRGYRDALTFMDYRLYIYHHLKTSARDLKPRFGQTLDIRFVSTPFESEQVGTQVYAAGSLYLPGILRHQSLKVTGSVQKQNVERYLMGNLVSMPRGFEQETAVMLRKISADYVFPIWYPDLNIWHAAYFKRLRGKLFLDHAFGQQVYQRDHSEGPVNKHFTSMGGELTTDAHFVQLIFPMNMGARVIYMPGEKSMKTEFVLSVDLNQF